MRRALAHVGVGLTLLAGPARGEPPADEHDRARAQALDRLHTRLAAERSAAQEQARHIAAASMWRHARAAPAE